MQSPIAADLIAELSALVPCDRRTLRKALAGGKVSRLSFMAIERALASRGLLGLLPQHRVQRPWWEASSTATDDQEDPVADTETVSAIPQASVTAVADEVETSPSRPLP